MYFAVAEFEFDRESVAVQDARALQGAAEKIRERFSCSAAVTASASQGRAAIAVALFHSRREELAKQLDRITESLEAHGIGRVDSERSILEDLEVVLEDDPADA